MRGNRFWYPVAFTAAYVAVWVGLHFMGADNPWIDRIIVGEIALCALFAVMAMSIATKRWTVRGLGIWGLMSAIVLIYGTSQVIQAGVWDTSPDALRNLWRAILAVAGPCMLYGYWVWWRSEDGDE